MLAQSPEMKQMMLAQLLLQAKQRGRKRPELTLKGGS
jgi:hypothetical protein